MKNDSSEQMLNYFLKRLVRWVHDYGRREATEEIVFCPIVLCDWVINGFVMRTGVSFGLRAIRQKVYI